MTQAVGACAFHFGGDQLHLPEAYSSRRRRGRWWPSSAVRLMLFGMFTLQDKRADFSVVIVEVGISRGAFIAAPNYFCRNSLLNSQRLAHFVGTKSNNSTGS